MTSFIGWSAGSPFAHLLGHEVECVDDGCGGPHQGRQLLPVVLLRVEQLLALLGGTRGGGGGGGRGAAGQGLTQKGGDDRK